MITERDITLARVAIIRWIMKLSSEIPKIWDAGFTDEAIDAAETVNELRDVHKKLGEIKNVIQASGRVVSSQEITGRRDDPASNNPA